MDLQQPCNTHLTVTCCEIQVSPACAMLGSRYHLNSQVPKGSGGRKLSKWFFATRTWLQLSTSSKIMVISLSFSPAKLILPFDCMKELVRASHFKQEANDEVNRHQNVRSLSRSAGNTTNGC